LYRQHRAIFFNRDRLGHNPRSFLGLKSNQPFQLDFEKKTPLHLAVCSGSPRTDKIESPEELRQKQENAKLCVEILIGAANHIVNWKDYEGRTALHLGKNVTEL
jgi:hypothetical protein